MLVLFGAMLLITAWALHLAWIATVVRSRGRNLVFWTLAGAAIGALGAHVGLLVTHACASASSDTVSMVGVTAPLPMTLLPMIGLAFLLARFPVKVVVGREWPVHAATNGTGRLMISPDTLHMAWHDRVDTIPRSSVQTVTVDGECLRIVWTEGELVLMPLLQPQTRAGRIRQCQTLERMLASEGLARTRTG